jgi:argininosuccinate synthase
MAIAASDGAKPIVLAYSGGLDTSFLVPWLTAHYRRPIITVTVNTGGIDAEAARTLERRARELGAVGHHLIDARADYFEQVLRFLIMGNVRRGQLYPLCVGAERVMQAQTIARMAHELGTTTIAHGCTAAGNDQVRFEVALRTLAPGFQTSGGARVPARAKSARPAFRRGLFGEPRPVGRDDRRPGDARIGGQHSGGCLGADA